MTKPLCLFLADDNEEVALLISMHLERAGHQVTACRTAADALIVLGNSTYHLVLIDDRLPDMRGVDLLQALHREGIRTPVVMMTANGSERHATQALLAGAIDYLVKDDALTFLTELPKRVQEAVTRYSLQQSNQLLVAALESARDGICITDLDGTMLHVNAALETMTGYTRHELIGQTPRLFKSGAHAADFYAPLWKTVLARQSWQGELVNRRKDGTQVDTSLTVSPIVDSRGKLTHLVGIMRDITERKQLERQLRHAQKMQSVGTLAGGVAHEFNNLLAGIHGYATLGLREPEVSPQLKEFLQFILDLSERAANLTRQLLAFARKPALSRRPTDIAKLLAITADFVRQSLSIDVNVEIERVTDGAEPLHVLADANQLQQVLVNLALNARDALTRPEPILFRLVRALLAEALPAFPENVPQGDYVMLEVCDRGKGMTAAVLEHALDPFFTTKEVGKGTGLGLPVASGIVHGHLGHLTLASAPGQGTQVRLYLPRLLGIAAAQVPPAKGVVQLESLKEQALSIIIIDDEKAVLDVMRRFLEIAGHSVTCVTTGTDALDLLSKGQSADLVILDLMIPHEDSAATFRQLRQRWPALPILLCTGVLQTDSAAPSFQGEPVQLIRKPFRMNELWQAVHQTLAATSSL